MKKWIFSAVITGCVLASMIVVPAQAQMAGSPMRVTIPFDFIVRGKTLPAGNYEIKRVNDESYQLLVVRNINDKREQVMFDTESVQPRTIPDNSEVVFHRYGDSYFLSEILTGGEQTGEELAPSRAERRLRIEMASNNTAEPETVSVAVY